MIISNSEQISRHIETKRQLLGYIFTLSRFKSYLYKEWFILAPL